MASRKKPIRNTRFNQLLTERFSGVQVAMANCLGITPSLISRYASGSKGIGEDMKELIEGKLNLSQGWLDGIENDAANTEPAIGLRGRVPLISWVQAGDFSHANDQFPPGYAEEFVDTTVNVGRHTFALRVKGDSMEPVFPEGAILVIEPDMDFHPNDYVVAKNGDNEVTFKQLIKDGADWYLKPLNPRYPIKPLGTSTIIGVVRQVTQEFR